MGKPTSTPPNPSIFEGRVPLCAPPQHRLAVKFLIAACASCPEGFLLHRERSFLCNKKSPPVPKGPKDFGGTTLFHSYPKNTVHFLSVIAGIRPAFAGRLQGRFHWSLTRLSHHMTLSLGITHSVLFFSSPVFHI